MKTYQDWLKVSDRSESERMSFIKTAIDEFKGSKDYRIAIDAEEYYAGRNPTITRYEKLIIDGLGQLTNDRYSANHKIASKIFNRIITQENLVLTGNGITWNDEATKEALGKNFDRQIYKAVRSALVEKAAYGFWNLDHLEIYEFREFYAFVDEEDGSIKAGIRFWQIDSTKPLRATMFEMDGYTDYIWDKDHPEGSVFHEKRAYIIDVSSTEAEGEIDSEGRNYSSFPVVPLYGNEMKQSELVGQRAKIDAFDLISSGYVNDEDDANFLYWTISNAGGMNDSDLLQMLDKLRKVQATTVDGDGQLQAHTIEVPFSGREAVLERLEKQIYRDAMALNTYDIAAGAVTATQIEASYEPLNQKLDLLEMQLLDFIDGILAVAGIDDMPSFTRSKLVNRTEEIQALMTTATIMDTDYLVEKIMTLLGDQNLVEDVLKKRASDDIQRLSYGDDEGEELPPSEGE